MATVTIDTIEGAECEERSGVIRNITRRAVVSELVPNSNEDQVLYDALNAAGMPQPGAAHPNITGLYVRRRTPRAISPSVVEVSILYRPFTFSLSDPETTEIPGSWYTTRVVTPLREIETEKDRLDVAIKLTHNDEEQGGTVRVRRPYPAIAIGGRITGASGSFAVLDDMTQFARTYAGKANSTGWYGDVSAAAKTWLCTDVSISLIELTDTVPQYPIWGVEFVFEDYTQDGTVDPAAVWIDPETGRPGVDLEDTTPPLGIATIDAYATVAFNTGINTLDGGP